MTVSPVRFVEADDETTISGWGIPYGGPYNGQDLYRTHFSAKTNYCFDWFRDGSRPLLYQHGKDPEIGPDPIGRVTGYELREAGVWVQAQLDKSHQYFEQMTSLIKDGKLYFSSGAMAHLLIEDTKSGEMVQWPWVEESLTPTPANLYATLDFAAADRSYRAAGLELPAQAGADDPATAVDPATKSAPPPAPEAPAGASAGAEHATRAAPAGSYEDLIEAIRDQLNPPNPFNFNRAYTCIVATYPEYVVVSRYDPDDDDDRQTYWRIDYTLDAVGAPQLGTAQQVEQVYVPVQAGRSAGPLTLDAQRLTRDAETFSRRTQDLAERRAAEGRALSPANARAFTEAQQQLSRAAAALVTLRERTDQAADVAARAAALASPEGIALQFEALRLFADSL